MENVDEGKHEKQKTDLTKTGQNLKKKKENHIKIYRKDKPKC